MKSAPTRPPIKSEKNFDIKCWFGQPSNHNTADYPALSPAELRWYVACRLESSIMLEPRR